MAKRKKAPKGASSSSRGPSPSTQNDADLEETNESRVRRSALSDSAIKALLSINGIKHEVFVRRAHLISKIEAFQARELGHDLSPLRHFTGLTEVSVMYCTSINSMDGLQYLPHLVTLWLNECSFTRIGPALRACRKLKALYMCQNKIRTIENLDNLSDLEVLWLCGNRISRIEGLSGCPKLRVLWLASNKIENIGTGLDDNHQLAELNLSNNKVGEFKQVLNLSRIETLRTLAFSDPHYGDNPICNLCNYQTYVLYHLGQLTNLDSMYISRESKQLAEATYMKKKMYYNMRIKTLKRNASNVIRMAHDEMQSKAGNLSLNLNVLLRQRKDLMRILEEREMLPSFADVEAEMKYQNEQDESENNVKVNNLTSEPIDERERELYESPDMESEIKQKLDAVDAAIRAKGQKSKELQMLFEIAKRELNDVAEESIARLIIELETGGNIRLEDGKQTDVWYTSCEDLLKSRFYAKHFRAYNIGDIRVHRVTRIHNRFLRNRFDAKMEHLAAKRNIRVDTGSSSSGKRNLEYLFFGDDPKFDRISGAGNEILRIPERGFRRAKDFALLGLDEAVCLSNSVSEAHLPAIRSFLSDSACELKRQQERAERQSQIANLVSEGAGSNKEAWAFGGNGVPVGSGVSVAAAAVSIRAAAASAAAAVHSASGKRLQAYDDEPVKMDISSKNNDGVVSSEMLRKAVASLVAGHFVLPDGKLLVAKVFLGRYDSCEKSSDAPNSTHSTVKESDSESNESSDDDMSSDDASSDSDANESDFGASNSSIRPGNFSDYDAVYRLNTADPKQRSWFVFDNALVLPEYIIEFELLTRGENDSKSSAPRKRANPSVVAAEILGRELSPQELIDIRPMLRPLERFQDACDRIIGDEKVMHPDMQNGVSDENGEELGKWSSAEETSGSGSPGSKLQKRALLSKQTSDATSSNSSSSILSLPPHLPKRPKLFVISRDVILNQCRTKAFENIVYLNLHGCSIRKIELLGLCINLRILVLTFNEIHKIEGLEELERLERLELGFNLIKRVEGLRELKNLKKMELNNNLLYRMDDINVIRASLPSLENLDLRHNALCDTKTYTATVLSKMPNLTRLDGMQITNEVRRAHVSSVEVITRSLIRQYAKGGLSFVPPSGTNAEDKSGIGNSDANNSKKDSEKVKVSPESPSAPSSPSAKPPLSPESSSDNFILAASGSSATNSVEPDNEDVDPWWTTIEALDLNHRHLQRIENLEKLKNLRRLSLADNEISRIEGLDECTLLEELVLEENRIIKLEGLSKLTFLKKLDLGKNKVSKLENLESLVHLTQLSIEDNQIESLSGLQHMTNLMELYMCNNRVLNLKEVQHLKTIPKLIILDLTGNRICKYDSYRLYCVYYLRKLKVLDGTGVDINEQHSAREKYSGKLTAEFLAEKIGHKYFEHIRELDLSSCRIREIEHLSGDEFSNLRELNLDNNMLTSIAGLHKLNKLTVLRLNHNRIRNLGTYSGLSPTKTERLSNTDKTQTATGGVGLSGLTSLEILQLGYNHVTDISTLNLHLLPEMKVLFLQGNDIVRVDGLSSCFKLRELGKLVSKPCVYLTIFSFTLKRFFS